MKKPGLWPKILQLSLRWVSPDDPGRTSGTAGSLQPLLVDLQLAAGDHGAATACLIQCSAGAEGHELRRGSGILFPFLPPLLAQGTAAVAAGHGTGGRMAMGSLSDGGSGPDE